MCKRIKGSRIKEASRFADRFVLHDQSLPGRNRDAVLGDEEARNGEDAAGARALPFDLDTRLVHEYVGAYYLLRRNRQVSIRHRGTSPEDAVHRSQIAPRLFHLPAEDSPLVLHGE